MYFFNAVDRSNIGNAETNGLSKDLHFVGNEYSLLILLFYIPFGTLDLPLNILTKRFTAALVLPILMITWGSVSLLQCAAFSFGGLLVCRLVMVACEAGFFDGVVFYLTLSTLASVCQKNVAASRDLDIQEMGIRETRSSTRSARSIQFRRTDAACDLILYRMF